MTAARAALCALLALTGCRQAQRPTSVVLVTIDTLRADRLGCYGYKPATTPNLDRLAHTGVLFENTVTQAPLTAPSHASIFTGTYPTVHGVRDTGGFVLQGAQPALAEIFHRQGWATAAFVGASVLKKAFGFNRGFDVYDDRMPPPEPGRTAGEYAERRAGEVVDRALKWLQGRDARPFFLWLHVFDPHSPYDPPPPFHGYDGEVAYTDRELGRLFDAVGRKFPGALIAVLSDHGESLSDHGEYTHGVFLYDSTLRIACILSGPGVPKGIRVKQQARAIDLLPTILELTGGKPPEGVQGASLVPAMAGKTDDRAWSYAESLYPKINMGWAELQAVRTNRWKYIRAPKPELYDLAHDPAETTNVLHQHPAEAKALEARLAEVAAEGEKVQTSMADRRTLGQLKSLGYLGGSSQSQYKLTGAGIDPKERTGTLLALEDRRIPSLRRALSEDPGNPTLYYYLGDEYDKAGRFADAMRLYQDGIRAGLRNAWLYSRTGRLYIRRGDLKDAIAAYEIAAQMNPADCESLSDLGMAYLDTNRPDDARRVYDWCLATGDEYAPAYNGLGLAAVRKNDMAAARGYFEKAVQADPNLLEAQLNLGRIYKLSGATAQARACFEAFLAKADPAEYGPLIPRIQSELAELR